MYICKNIKSMLTKTSRTYQRVLSVLAIIFITPSVIAYMVKGGFFVAHKLSQYLIAHEILHIKEISPYPPIKYALIIYLVLLGIISIALLFDSLEKRITGKRRVNVRHSAYPF